MAYVVERDADCKAKVDLCGWLLTGAGLVFFPLLFVGIGVMIWSAKALKKNVCSECGSDVGTKHAVICPACEIKFETSSFS